MNEQATRLGATERRAQLFAAARETFGTKGFTATSMNDIAVAAGVTKPLLYQHFESKHQLFLEILTDTAASLIKAIGDAVGASESGREKIENGMAAAVHFFGESPSSYQVFYGEGVRTEPDFAEVHRVLIDALHQFTAEHIDIESLSKEQRILAATGVAGQLEAVVGHWINTGQEQSAAEVASLLSSLAWRGLRGTT